jgi:hypothetical protein
MVVRSGAAAATLLLPDWAGAAGGAQRARVVVVTTKAAISQAQPPSIALVERMIEKGVTLLAGKSDPVQAWSSFVRPTDFVCLPNAGGQMENQPEVNIALYRALAKLGVKRMTVGTHRMSADWRDRVLAGVGDAKPEFITGKLFGIAHLPMDALVVTPTVKHHDISGISGTLKLYACFSKQGPSNYHGDTPAAASANPVGAGMGGCGWVPANDFKEVRKLHIVDMIRVGTTSRDWVNHPDGWVYTRSLVFTTDPVAADRVAFDIYLKYGQSSGRIDPLYHVNRAEEQYHAGVADLARIDIRHAVV